MAAQTSVGILPFTNETGDPAADSVARSATWTLQKRLHVETGVIPKLLTAPRAVAGDADAGSVAFLKSTGVTHLVRGAVVAFPSSDSGDAAPSLVLTADVLAARTGQSVTVEAEGGAGIDALDTAIAALTTSILDAIASGGEARETETEGEASAEAEDAEEQPEPPAPGDLEELQQLLSQAESFSGTAAQRDAVQAAVAQLLAALEGRAALLEQEEEPSEESESEAESEISGGQDLLEDALEAGHGEAVPEESGLEESPSSFSVQTITTLLDSTLQIIQRIQEMRSAERGLREEESLAEEPEADEGSRAPRSGDASESEGEEDPQEEELEEVTGAVTDNGAPVEGAVVTEPDLGISATTRADGSYTLSGVPPRWASLQVSRGGHVVARGNVDVVFGRRALADFEIKTPPGASVRSTPMSRVHSPIVSVPSKGPSGTVAGTVEDAQGRPLPRAQVTLPNLAVARTDSKGRYEFRRVPVGTHTLEVSGAGLATAVRRVNVSSGSRTQAVLRCAAATARRDAIETLKDPGAGTRLSGSVTDDGGRPIAGARILATRSGRSLSVSTRGDGGFTLRGLKAGSYRVVATKVGYRDAVKSVEVATRSDARENFRLRRATSQSLLKVAAKGGAHGDVKGRIVGADRRGVAGARVSLEKAGRAVSVSSVTGKDGSYRVRAQPGTYRLRASKDGLHSYSRDVRVGTGATRVEDIVLGSSSKKDQASGLTGQSSAANSRKLVGQMSASGAKAGGTKRWLVYGRVTDEGSGRPIAGASVSLSDTRFAMSPHRTTRSDADGSYDFQIETQGAFRLRVVKSGFLTEEKPVHVGSGSRVSVDLRLRPKKSIERRSATPSASKSRSLFTNSTPKKPTPKKSAELKTKSTASAKPKPTPKKGGPK
jgi:protocatechuate 3,4-dioxygenase beta subunit